MPRRIHALYTLYQHFAAMTIAEDLDHCDGVESLDDSQQCNGVLYSQIALVCQTTLLGAGHAYPLLI